MSIPQNAHPHSTSITGFCPSASLSDLFTALYSTGLFALIFEQDKQCGGRASPDMRLWM